MNRAWMSLVCLLEIGISAQATAGLIRQEITVDGQPRTALVHLPNSARTQKTPVVFIFHGHGGSAENAARSFHLEHEWPEAICVYMQGLPTPGVLTDPEGKRPGWQMRAGAQGDRDLKFFDAMLAHLKETAKVDPARIYATGHSNGGAFTYLLWLKRGDMLAAVAPSAAAAIYARQLSPKPSLILGGTGDRLVKWTWQEATIEAVRKVDAATGGGRPWEGEATLYSSRTDTPVVTYIHSGGHQFDSAIGPGLIARFFQQH